MRCTNTMDLVSIIIPYHKKREYITDTLKSVLKQTYKNIEIIIIYDDDEKEEQIVLNPEYLEIREELEREDMRTEEIEGNSVTSDNDDY